MYRLRRLPGRLRPGRAAHTTPEPLGTEASLTVRQALSGLRGQIPRTGAGPGSPLPYLPTEQPSGPFVPGSGLGTGSGRERGCPDSLGQPSSLQSEEDGSMKKANYVVDYHLLASVIVVLAMVAAISTAVLTLATH